MHIDLYMKKILQKMAVFAMAAVLLLSGCSGTAPAASEGPGSETSENAPAEASGAASSQGASSGSGSLSPDDPVTLTLWHYYTGDNQLELEAAVEQFNQSVGHENGVIVEAVAKGTIGELEDAVTESAMGVIHSEEMPDIFSCYADKAESLNESGALCDMSEYFTQEEQDQYVAGFIDDGIISDKLLVLPIVKSTELLYVSKTALDEFSAANPGVYTDSSLSTWQSLYALSKAYYEWTDAQTPDTPWDGKGFMGIDEIANFLIISNKQLGVDLLDGDTGSVNLNQEVLKTIFGVYYPAWSLGYFDSVGQFCSDDVKTGDLAAYVGSSSGASYFPTFTEKDNQQVDIELLAASYPVFEGGEEFTVQQGAGMAVAKTDALREEASCLFLKWFTDVPQNVPFAMNTGYLPVKQAAYTSEEFDDSLAALKADSSTDARNLEQVYSIALEAILEGSPYAAKPFANSYSIRGMLRSTLSDAAAAGREQAQTLKAQNMTPDEIVAALDVDVQFEEWMNTVRSQLDEMGVTYTEA